MKYNSTFRAVRGTDEAMNRNLVGIEDQFKRLAGTINEQDLMAKKPWVDVRIYASFSAAIDAIGSTKTILVIPDEQAITADKTVPSNITVKITQGGALTSSNSSKVIFNGYFEAGLYHVFKGNLVVEFGAGAVKEIYPQWWGAKGDGVTDDTAAIQAACANGGPVLVSSGIYITNAPIVGPNSIFGTMDASTIKAGPSFPTSEYLFTWENLSYGKLSGLKFDSNYRARGIRIKGPMYLSVMEDILSVFALDGYYGMTFDGDLAANRFLHVQSQGNTYGFLIGNTGDSLSYDNLFSGIRSQCSKGGIHLKRGCNRTVFISVMIDCNSTDANTFGIKTEIGASNNYNTFVGAVAENTSANGTGFDDIGISGNVYLNCMVSGGFATPYNLSTYNWRLTPGDKFEGAEFRSNNRFLILSGRFYGESPDGTMTWSPGGVRSDAIAGDGVYDVWEFPIPVRNGALIVGLYVYVVADATSTCETKVQIFKQTRMGATTQVGGDYTFIGPGDHTVTNINYTIENDRYVFVRVSCKFTAAEGSTYMYLYPLMVEGGW